MNSVIYNLWSDLLYVTFYTLESMFTTTEQN